MSFFNENLTKLLGINEHGSFLRGENKEITEKTMKNKNQKSQSESETSLVSFTPEYRNFLGDGGSVSTRPISERTLTSSKRKSVYEDELGDDEVSFCSEDSGMNEWDIQQIVCGDGTSLTAERSLEESRFYGSGSTDGGKNTFWELEIETLRLVARGSSLIQWPFRALTEKAKNSLKAELIPHRPVVNISELSVSEAEKSMRTGLRKWLERYKGFSVTVGGAGSRVKSVKSEKFRVVCLGEVFSQSTNERNCAIEATLNAISLLLGNETAQQCQYRIKDAVTSASNRVKRKKPGAALISDFQSIGEIGSVLQELKIGLSIEKVKMGSKYQCKSKMDFILKLYNKTAINGVFLVRLKQTHVCDHVVVIDARKWPRLIFDSAEKFPLLLSPTSVLLCGGEDFKCVFISEVYRVVVQPKGKRSRKVKQCK